MRAIPTFRANGARDPVRRAGRARRSANAESARGPVARHAESRRAAPGPVTPAGATGEAVVSVDGRIGSPETARLNPLDRGFLHGEAVYENLRTYGGVPFLLGRHLERLRASARALGIPVAISDREAASRLAATRRAVRFSGEQSIRVILTAGPAGGTPSLVILVRPLPPLPVDPERAGVGVFRSERVRSEPGGLPPGVKTTNLLGSRLAVREAEASGAHEAVLRGPSGELTEGATSNLFLVEGGVVRTPPADAGLLPGITRALALEVLGDLGIPGEEARLPPSRLETAAEAFLTSSSREVLPVVWSVAPGEPRRPVGNGEPGPVTLRILAGYRRAVARLLEAPASAAR